MTRADEKYNEWLACSALDAELKAQLLAYSQDEKEDSFYRDLAFGTGGLRGVIGAGTNRMNIYTVAKATRGIAKYLKSDFSTPSCAIAYDSRNKSDVFAKIAAATFAAEGVKVYIYKELMPTPMLSFAVRHLGTSGGVVVTASHNPAKYNGYKVYGDDGCQKTLEAAEKALAFIEKEADFADNAPDFDAQLAAGNIEYITDETINAFYAAVLDQSAQKPAVPLNVVYSPLNGAGNKPVRHILDAIGNVNVTVVPEQEKPDGNFPTCPYPNPEIEEAMRLSVALCKEKQADFCLATDPDCDRAGTAALDKNGDVQLINGNEMGVMLLDFVCQMRIKKGTMPARPVAVKTIVTTEMAAAVAKEYGVELRNVLTGFKFIGEQIGLLEKEGETERYIFGFEESYGYLSGGYVRDKDAVDAAMLICEMAAHYKAQGKSLLDVRDALYEKYGYYKNELLSFAFEGASGMDKMNAIIDTVRTSCPESFAGHAVEGVIDYENDDTGLPKSNVLALSLNGGCQFIVRPSGTEPKLKIYITAKGATAEECAQTAAALSKACAEYVDENSR